MRLAEPSLRAPLSFPLTWRVPLASVAALLAAGSLLGCGSASDGGDVPCGGSSCAPPGGNARTDQPPAPSGDTPPADEPPPVAGPGAPTPSEMQAIPLPLDESMPPPPAGPAVTDSGVNADAAELLDLVVKFYGAQRSGDGDNWLLGGATCHLNDGEAITQDLSGGWYDAGDHVKVTLSIAYASYLMLKAYDAFPEAFGDRDSQDYAGAPNGVPDVLDEVRYATDYLVKAHISEAVLVGMVGNAQQDHSQWVTCMDQEALPALQGGRPRPVSTQANADVSGITSAALALMSRAYRPFDAALADSYQSHAVSIYQIGKNNPLGSNPGLYRQTGEGWLDEMLAGSAELYRLTNDSLYLDDALGFNTRIENHGWAPNYSQSADFSRHTLYVAGAADAVSEYWRLDVENYLAKVSSNEFTADLIYIDEWGVLRYAAAAAFSSALYSEVTGDTAARELAIGQLNYITGGNGYSRSFVVGFGTNPPLYPHHRNADNLGVSLAGALVGGPTQRSYTQGTGANAIEITTPGYEDDVDDYVGNEVTLDYNAGIVGLAAFGAHLLRPASSLP